jgi:tRNA threonylcarbamoyladenosine biosynthesis protein TsaE
MELTYTLKEIEKTAEILIENFTSNVILFHAPMGAGKTTLIKSICKKLGVHEEITSPTFSLVNEYEGALKDVMHFDLYRIEDSDQLYDIGFDDYLEKDAYQFIEWPEFAIPYLNNYQIITIEIIDLNTRKLILSKDMSQK